MLGCLGLAVLSFLLALSLGEQPLSWTAIGEPESTAAVIFYSLRLPRVALAALVGSALAASGASLQSLLRNPLADPFVLGVSGGAALGATVALAFGNTTWPWFSVAGFALGGAVAATVAVLTIGRLAGSGPHAVLLAGVIFNTVSLAAITFIKVVLAPDKLGEVLFWLAGSLGHESWPTLCGAAIMVLGSIAMLMFLAPQLNLLSLGEDDAHSLGVDVPRTRRFVLLASSTAVAVVVSLAGLIGFVGLVVPHLVRLLWGGDQRLSVPASALLGASFLMLADLAARLLFRAFATEPPVGVITAMMGGSVFLVLMLRRTL